jgi:hypothetical protein
MVRVLGSFNILAGKRRLGLGNAEKNMIKKSKGYISSLKNIRLKKSVFLLLAVTFVVSGFFC